jgi:hypothetical protein
MNVLLKRILILTLISSLQAGLFIGVSEASTKATESTITTDSDTKITTKKYVKGNTTKTVVTTVVTTTSTSS